MAIPRVVFTARICYPNLITAKPFDQNDPNSKVGFSLEGVIEPNTDLTLLKAACDQAMLAKIGKTLPAKLPIRKGDSFNEDRAANGKEPRPELVGKLFFRAKSTNKILVVDQNNQPIMEEGIIYSGCYCLVNVTPFYYAFDKKSGLSLYLNGVRFLKDGEPLGGGVASAEDLFGTAELGGSSAGSNYDLI